MSSEIINIENLYDKISSLLEASRKNLKKSVNTIMVSTYFEVGRLIVEEEQQGEERAKYGKYIIENLSKKLTREYGKGFSTTNLKQMKSFYIAYCLMCCKGAKTSYLAALFVIQMIENFV